MTHGVSRSSLQDLWAAAEVRDEERNSSSLESTVRNVNWLIENRGGLAWLTGLAVVPSQFLGPRAEKSEKVIAEASRSNRIERFTLPAKDDTLLEGVICYPKNWNPEDRSCCVLYHNPNGITVSGYFETGALSWTPAEILKLAQCPIVMYDYRGTGLSSENQCSSSVAFKPTYESIVIDGETALQYALEQFAFVKVIGSSLGGGVATASLDRHLKARPIDSPRISLLNHDSFSTTPKVVMPHWPRVANWAGWALGGLLDAETPMKNLVERDIPITVLCHEQDPVIPRGARMAEFVETLPKWRNISIIYSSRYGHADLSQDMIQRLGKI